MRKGESAFDYFRTDVACRVHRLLDRSELELLAPTVCDNKGWSKE
jgi:hypothetical protein